MNQLQKYTWLIDKLQRAGMLSLRELSEYWENDKDINCGDKLSRATFNRWRDAILDQFGIVIKCRRKDGYLYYIENPEDIRTNNVKKWMLDSFAVGNSISDHLSLKDRILIDEIPSGRDHLTTLLKAMKESRRVMITHCRFKDSTPKTFPIDPYCVKLFENRWYVLAYNYKHANLRLYGLDRISAAEICEETFDMPDDFSASDYFRFDYGIVHFTDIKPQRIVLRANEDHKYYMLTLPLHHSQRLLEDNGEYADFELYLSPTYDFVMKLLHMGSMIEVISPQSLRDTMSGWISDMYELYNNDKDN